MKRLLIVLLVVGLLVGACCTAVMSEEESLDEVSFTGGKFRKAYLFVN